MDLRKVTTFPSPQCQQPRQQDDRVLASFHQVLAQGSHAIIEKNLDTSKTTVENSNERRNKNATTDRIPKRKIQNARLVIKQTTRQNGVGKAPEPTSKAKTSNWITPNPRKRPRVKMTLTINKLLPSSKTQKTRFATTPFQ